MAKHKSFANHSLGGKFRHICVVGLNRCEVYLHGQTEPLTGEHWSEITEESTRKHMAFCFFAPQTVGDGDILDPYLYLAADPGNTPEDEQQARTMTEQLLNKAPLLDLCRAKESQANTAHFLIAADVIFHWDSDGAYIQPTSKQTWVRDLQKLIKNYNRGAHLSVYTNWQHDQYGEIDNIERKKVHEMPFDQSVWLNMPSFYDNYGSITMLVGIAAAALAFGGIYLQQQKLTQLTQQVQQLERGIPKVANLGNLGDLLSEQDNHMQWRDLFPFAMRDMGFAIQTAGMLADELELKVYDPNRHYDSFVALITSETNAYQGWLQEEPIAKSVLAHSVALSALRKPPGGGRFRLEGLIDLKQLNKTLEENTKDGGDAS